MEEGKDFGIEFEVRLSKRCEKAYKKLSKKADPKLLKTVNDTIDKLKINPHLGKKLTQDLNGMRSIRLKEFCYRIVYEVEKNSGNIIIHGIVHRTKVYDDIAKYFGRGSYDNPEM